MHRPHGRSLAWWHAGADRPRSGGAVRDLRISVTDRCNFRCTVLHARGGHAVAAARRGPDVRGDRAPRRPGDASSGSASISIRLTGGEPTVQAHLPVLVGKLRRAGRSTWRMTTNGADAARCWPTTCAPPGCGGSTSPSTSLRRDRFVELTRRDELRTCSTASTPPSQAGFDPVKVNASCMRGVNDDEVVDLAALRRATGGVEVRFIEFMPLDAVGPLDARRRSSARTRSSSDRRRLPARARCRRGRRRPARPAVRLPATAAGGGSA